jgi:metal-responsive CopG/Arc/MetJ family transcriptional regulator
MLHVRINERVIDELDKIAAASGKTRTDLMREAVIMLVGSYREAGVIKESGDHAAGLD